MTTKKLLELRKEMNKRRPNFLPQDIQKRREITRGRWRKPKGMHSKMRDGLWGRPVCVGTGYRGPSEIRGMHPSGLMPVLVYNNAELDKIDTKTQGIILGHIGDRKKITILNTCKQKNITVLNVKKIDEAIKTLTEKAAVRKQAKTTKTAPKEIAPKAKEAEPMTKEQERREAEKILTKKE